jgi:hypothetical protein
VVISFAGIGSGLVIIYGLLTGKRFDASTATFLVTTILTTLSGFLFPVQHPLPAHIIGITSLVVLGVAVLAALWSPNGALVALDLCSLRGACSLSECIRRGGAVVYEDNDCPRIGSDAKRDAVSRHATRGDNDFRGDWYFRGEEVPHQTSVCPGSPEEL